MPSARNPDVRGNLYVTFAIDFPPDNTLSDEALSTLERVLPARPERNLSSAAATASEQPSEPATTVEDDVEKTMRNLLGDAYEPAAEKSDGEGGEGASPQKTPAPPPEPEPEPEIELIAAQLEELPSAARDARAKAQARRQRFNPFAAMFGGAFAGAGEFNDSDEEGSSPSRERKRGAEGEDSEHPEGGARHDDGGDTGGQQHREAEGDGEGDDDDEVEETMRNLLGDEYEPGVEEADEAGERGGQRGPQVQCATS